MALVKSKSKKCPVCVGCTDSKAQLIDAELTPILNEVKTTGEIPKANDARLLMVSNSVGIAPASLRYHLKECLLDVEIQDQRFAELKDLVEAIQTAKQEYLVNPSMQQAAAYTSLLSSFRSMAEDIEGQVDPEVTVEYITESVLGPINRRILAAMAEELRSLRETLFNLVANNHKPYIDSQVKSVLSRMSTALRESTDESLKSLCTYYKVELEAQQRKRALDSSSLSDHDRLPNSMLKGKPTPSA